MTHHWHIFFAMLVRSIFSEMNYKREKSSSYVANALVAILAGFQSESIIDSSPS